MSEQTFDGNINIYGSTFDVDCKRSAISIEDIPKTGKLARGIGKIEEDMKVKVTIKIEKK